MKKLIILAIALVATIGLFAADGTLTLPGIQQSLTATNLTSNNDWAPVNDGSGIFTGVFKGTAYSNIVYGTNAVLASARKVSVKATSSTNPAQLHAGIALKMYCDGLAGATKTFEQTPNSQGTIAVGDGGENMISLAEAKTITAADFAFLTNIHGGTFNLNNSLKYEIR